MLIRSTWFIMLYISSISYLFCLYLFYQLLRKLCQHILTLTVDSSTFLYSYIIFVLHVLGFSTSDSLYFLVYVQVFN